MKISYLWNGGREDSFWKIDLFFKFKLLLHGKLGPRGSKTISFTIYIPLFLEMLLIKNVIISLVVYKKLKKSKILMYKGRRTTYDDGQKPTAKGHLSEGIKFTAICCYLWNTQIKCFLLTQNYCWKSMLRLIKCAFPKQ